MRVRRCDGCGDDVPGGITAFLENVPGHEAEGLRLDFHDIACLRAWADKQVAGVADG